MLYPIMEPKHPSAERKLVAPSAKGAAALRLPDPDALPPPYVDTRLVRPETREELLDGRRIEAVPANPEHGDEHTLLDRVMGTHAAHDRTPSTDLLTHADEGSDFATDLSIRRSGIDPRTGSRYLEELAFEVVNEQSMPSMIARAHKLSACGVRRIFAVFVKKGTHDVLIDPEVNQRDVGDGSRGICFASGSEARIMDRDDVNALQGHLWLATGIFGLLNYVVLTVVAGGTVGKLIFGLRVVTARGQRAGFGRNLVRWLFLIVDAACCYLPGLLTSFNTKGHRRIGDLVAGTYVVHRSAEGRLLHIPGHLHVKGRHEYGSFGPAPVAPDPTLGTGGGIDAPVFDPSRNAYVRYDQASGVWFQWDERTQAWVPAQQ